MRVILLEKVPKLGEIGDIKEVSDGYAANFLVPRNLAKPATENIVKNTQKEVEKKKEEEAKRKEELKKKASKLEGKSLVIEKKAKEGKLFGSVKERDLIELLVKDGFEENDLKIKFDKNIKNTGKYKAEVVVGGEVKVEISFEIKEKK